MHVPSSDPLNYREACTVAVCHADELYYVFHSSAFVNATYTPDESNLSLSMLSYWRNFAHGDTSGFGSNPSWPLYETSTNISLAFDIPVSTVENYHNQKVFFSFFHSNFSTYSNFLPL